LYDRKWPKNNHYHGRCRPGMLAIVLLFHDNLLLFDYNLQ